jgi:hypothetical protein
MRRRAPVTVRATVSGISRKNPAIWDVNSALVCSVFLKGKKGECHEKYYRMDYGIRLFADPECLQQW